jgi:hypothetical protein
VNQERLAARLRPTRVAIAMVMTMPPTISGSQVSMPVRAVVRVPVVVAGRVVVAALLELVLLLLLLFEFEFEFDCAAATPASDSVIRTPRKTPAITRRVTAPVVRTFFSPQTRLWMGWSFGISRGNSCPTADRLREAP